MSTKLNLNKETIATLDAQESARILGGDIIGAASVNTKFTNIKDCCSSRTKACSEKTVCGCPANDTIMG